MSHNNLDYQPLGLTVHNPPSVDVLRSAAAQRQQQRKGRWRMLWVMLVCAAPVVASYWTYYVVRPEARRNFGQLIEPQQPMPAHLVARNLQGEGVSLAALQGQWLLISAAGGACAAPCEQHLYLQRQLREGLGREKDRLDWVWLIADEQPPSDALQSALQSALVLHVPRAQLQSWLQPAQGQRLEDHLYVVDPMGHWMLRFPASLSLEQASRAKRDLERLMRASASWDQPGRS